MMESEHISDSDVQNPEVSARLFDDMPEETKEPMIPRLKQWLPSTSPALRPPQAATRPSKRSPRHRGKR